MKKFLKALVYILAGSLLAFYIFMLFLCTRPRVSNDYRMRYLEQGYFWEEHNK